jgi:hypothetical protein
VPYIFRLNAHNTDEVIAMHDKEHKEIPRSMEPDEAVFGEPVDTVDLINKYGTYEVQDTTDTDNVFPLIGPFGAGINGVTLPGIPNAVKDEPHPKKE